MSCDLKLRLELRPSLNLKSFQMAFLVRDKERFSALELSLGLDWVQAFGCLGFCSFLRSEPTLLSIRVRLAALSAHKLSVLSSLRLSGPNRHNMARLKKLFPQSSTILSWNKNNFLIFINELLEIPEILNFVVNQTHISKLTFIK